MMGANITPTGIPARDRASMAFRRLAGVGARFHAPCQIPVEGRDGNVGSRQALFGHGAQNVGIPFNQG